MEMPGPHQRLTRGDWAHTHQQPEGSNQEKPLDPQTANILKQMKLSHSDVLNQTTKTSKCDPRPQENTNSEQLHHPANHGQERLGLTGHRQPWGPPTLRPWKVMARDTCGCPEGHRQGCRQLRGSCTAAAEARETSRTETQEGDQPAHPLTAGGPAAPPPPPPSPGPSGRPSRAGCPSCVRCHSTQCLRWGPGTEGRSTRRVRGAQFSVRRATRDRGPRQRGGRREGSSPRLWPVPESVKDSQTLSYFSAYLLLPIPV